MCRHSPLTAYLYTLLALSSSPVLMGVIVLHMDADVAILMLLAVGVVGALPAEFTATTLMV